MHLFDVQVFNPHAPLNRHHNFASKRAYKQKVQEVEHGSFTPLVLPLTGGPGNPAPICYKRLASMLFTKHEQLYKQCYRLPLTLFDSMHNRCSHFWWSCSCLQKQISHVYFNSNSCVLSTHSYSLKHIILVLLSVQTQIYRPPAPIVYTVHMEFELDISCIITHPSHRYSSV